MRQLRTVVVAFLLVILLSSSMVGVAQAGSKKDPLREEEAPPECQVPEVPWTLVLPVAGVAIAGIYYVADRRRHAGDTTPRP